MMTKTLTVGPDLVRATASPSDQRCPLKRWDVRVDGFSSVVTAETRGKALADTWGCDAFGHLTFGEFLKRATCRRAPDPEWWGKPCTVNGKPAWYLGQDGQYVHICMHDRRHVSYAHPSEVLPQHFRPKRYRTDIVDSIPDSELLKRAVRNARSRSRRGYHTRWQAVMDVFALGSTFAWQLCTRYGLDPEEKVR